MAPLTGKGEKIGVRRCHRVTGADEHPWDDEGQSRSLGRDRRPEELGGGSQRHASSHHAAIRWTSHTSHGGGTGTFLYGAPEVLFYEIFLGWRFSRTNYKGTADNDSANVTSAMVARSQPTPSTAGERPGGAASSRPAAPRLEEPENTALNAARSYQGW